MTDLVEFIRARLGEAEARARKDLWMIERATPVEKWTAAYGYNLPYSLLGEDGSIGRITSSYGRPLADGEPDQHQADAMLVGRLVRRAAREAGRALRDVEAKRRLLAEHHPVDPCDAHDASLRTVPCTSLLLLALPYADHPDWREEWRP